MWILTLNFLRELGLDENQSKQIMTRHRAVACCKTAYPKKNLDMDFLNSLGLTKEQSKAVIANHKETIDSKNKSDEFRFDSRKSRLSSENLYAIMLDDEKSITDAYAIGYTNEMIMDQFGYPEKGFYEVLREHPELKSRLNRGKLKHRERLLHNLDSICEWHEIVEITEMPGGTQVRKTKQVPPNVRALIFNITNRMPKEFQVTPAISTTDDNTSVTIVENLEDDENK